MFNPSFAIANSVGTRPHLINTPWGVPQTADWRADGIVFVSTASHGGFILSKERFDEMPLTLCSLSFTQDQCFEEDCVWCAVPLAFPWFFSDETVQNAEQCMKRWYPDQFDQWVTEGKPTAPSPRSKAVTASDEVRCDGCGKTIPDPNAEGVRDCGNPDDGHFVFCPQC